MKSLENKTSERNLSFYYLNENSTDEYKSKIKIYLSKKAKEIEKIGKPGVIVELYDFNRIKNKNPTGHIYLLDIENNANNFEEICNYILSKNRKFIPQGVKCGIKEDYDMIKDILKENYDKDVKLRNYFWTYGRVIKINKPKT
jgi:hypothetical protein